MIDVWHYGRLHMQNVFIFIIVLVYKGINLNSIQRSVLSSNKDMALHMITLLKYIKNISENVESYFILN